MKDAKVVPDSVPNNLKERNSEGNENEDEDIFESYQEISQNWLKLVGANKKLTSKVTQLRMENEDCYRRIVDLEAKPVKQ